MNFLGNNGCIIDCSMTEAVSYIGSFLPFYKKIPLISWENPYALFSGTCPIYRYKKILKNLNVFLEHIKQAMGNLWLLEL